MYYFGAETRSQSGIRWIGVYSQGQLVGVVRIPDSVTEHSLNGLIFEGDLVTLREKSDKQPALLAVCRVTKTISRIPDLGELFGLKPEQKETEA